MTRRFTATTAIAAILLLIVLDLSAAAPNPYAAPSLMAFGSGVAPSGGFCGAVPD